MGAEYPQECGLSGVLPCGCPGAESACAKAVCVGRQRAKGRKMGCRTAGHLVFAAGPSTKMARSAYCASPIGYRCGACEVVREHQDARGGPGIGPLSGLPQAACRGESGNGPVSRCRCGSGASSGRPALRPGREDSQVALRGMSSPFRWGREGGMVDCLSAS